MSQSLRQSDLAAVTSLKGRTEASEFNKCKQFQHWRVRIDTASILLPTSGVFYEHALRTTIQLTAALFLRRTYRTLSLSPYLSGLRLL